MRVLELTAYWELEGLVPKDGIGDPSADTRSLLRAWIKWLFIKVVEGALEESDCTCKIHDVMRDLVFYIFVHDNTPLKKQLFLSQVGQNLEHFPLKWTTKSKEHFNVWRLSFMYNNLTSLIETAFLAHEMCTFIIEYNLSRTFFCKVSKTWKSWIWFIANFNFCLKHLVIWRNRSILASWILTNYIHYLSHLVISRNWSILTSHIVSNYVCYLRHLVISRNWGILTFHIVPNCMHYLSHLVILRIWVILSS
jgi:hypothetical protein